MCLYVYESIFELYIIPLGNNEKVKGKHMMNIWQGIIVKFIITWLFVFFNATSLKGIFPSMNKKEDGFASTAPVT